MPGILVSTPKIGSPRTILGLSIPPMARPMMTKSFSSFSGTLARSGTFDFAAAEAISP